VHLHCSTLQSYLRWGKQSVICRATFLTSLSNAGLFLIYRLFISLKQRVKTMVEHFVPEGPAYLPNSFGPGFGPCHSSLGRPVKSEKLEDLFSYQADTPPSRDLSSSSWSAAMGYWLGDEIDNMGIVDTPTNMYDFDLLTPESTPPRITSQSDDIGDLSDVLSSLSSHPSPTFAVESVDNMLPLFSPPGVSPPPSRDMAVLSPPPVIHTCAPPPQATPLEQKNQSPVKPTLPSASASMKHKASGGSGGTKRRRLTEPRKQRKREQNKAAALKYRSRKKQEKETLEDKRKRLEQENTELMEQVKNAKEEIAYLKSMIQEVCAPASTMIQDVPSCSEDVGSFGKPVLASDLLDDLHADVWSEIHQQLGPLFPF